MKAIIQKVYGDESTLQLIDTPSPIIKKTNDISLFSEIFETSISDINNSILITSIIIFAYTIIVNIKETYFIWKK
jgi:hypothetical protein